MNEERKSQPLPTIKSVRVKDLFGTYSYFLRPSTEQIEDDSLFLLYGDNGAGKSTILKLLFHLLHPEPFGGHRTFISTVPFRTFEIELNNGLRISASKSNIFATDNYHLHLHCPTEQNPVEWTWTQKAKEQPKRESMAYEKICDTLVREGPNLLFLPDTRKTQSGTLKAMHSKNEALEELLNLRSANQPDQSSLEHLTSVAVERMAQWFRQQTITDTNVGYTSVNAVYIELLKTLIEKRKGEKNLSVVDLRSKLQLLKERNAKFARYGLTPDLQVSELDNLLVKAKPSDGPLLAKVLKPYLDGYDARLDALARTQSMIDQFVMTIAEFFSHKTLEFNLGNGVKITSSIGRELRPELLSSGEKQLLLLFCNAVTARRDGTIFIIDEPEISLNIKWQRKLIKSLLGCLTGVKAQIVMATHSIEILAQYKSYLTPLDNSDA